MSEWLDLMSGQECKIEGLFLLSSREDGQLVLPNLKKFVGVISSRKMFESLATKCPHLTTLDILIRQEHETWLPTSLDSLPQGLKVVILRAKPYVNLNILNLWSSPAAVSSLRILIMAEDTEELSNFDVMPHADENNNNYPLSRFEIHGSLRIVTKTDAMQQFLKKCRNMQHLRLDKTLTGEQIIDLLSGFRRLKSLILVKSRTNDAVALEVCSHSGNTIERLEFFELDALKRTTLVEIAKCPQLSYLSHYGDDYDSRKKMMHFIRAREQLNEKCPLIIDAFTGDMSRKMVRAADKAGIQFVDEDEEPNMPDESVHHYA